MSTGPYKGFSIQDQNLLMQPRMWFSYVPSSIKIYIPDPCSYYRNASYQILVTRYGQLNSTLGYQILTYVYSGSWVILEVGSQRS